MVLRIILSTGLVILLSVSGFAQNRVYSLSLFNHATSLPAGSWAGAWHPGFDLGWQTRLRVKEKSQTFLHWKFGYYFHRLVHHGFQLYGEYNWNLNLYKNLGGGVSAGLGYLHTLESHEIFKLNADGSYQKTGGFGKAHAQLSSAINLHYTLQQHLQPFLQYRFRIVTPFVNEYVPLLPAVSLHAGIFVQLHPPKSKS